MKRHDTIDLWSYAARDLGSEDSKLTEDHLLDCPECAAALLKVQAAREVLGASRSTLPKLSLERADAAIAREVSKRLLRKARPVRWGLALTPVALAAVAIAAWATLSLAPPAPEVAPVAEQAAVTASEVERAVELTRSSNGEGLSSGSQLSSGEVVSTGARGVAVLRLPESSKVRLASATRLLLSATSRRNIALQLDKGRVAVHAAHVAREAFTLRAADVTVHVLGTTFSVQRTADWVEVAVVEGRVGVESPRGLPFFVGAGETVRVGTKTWRPVSRPVAAATREELKEVTPAPGAVPAAGGPTAASPRPTPVGPAPTAAPSPAAAPVVTVPLVVTPLDQSRVGAAVQPQAGALEAAPSPADEWAPMPGSHAPIGLRGVAEPNSPEEAARVAQAAKATPPAAAPGPAAPAPQVRATTAAAPAAGGAPTSPVGTSAPPATAGGTPAAAPPQGSAPVPGAAAPAAPAVTPVTEVPAPSTPPSTRATESRGPLPEDLEELFLMRAERALRNGACDRYLLGLADIAEDPQRTVRQERARIAMARCHEAFQQVELASVEFQRYLRDFPRGLFAREASAGVAPAAPAPVPATAPGPAGVK